MKTQKQLNHYFLFTENGVYACIRRMRTIKGEKDLGTSMDHRLNSILGCVWTIIRPVFGSSIIV